MIADTAVLSEIQESWTGVEILHQRLNAAILGAFSEGSSFGLFAAYAAHNLPFVHACAVLNDALKQLEQEGHFHCKSIFLGALLSASNDKLPWKNFRTIEEVVSRRNDIAHRAEVIPRVDCWRFIDAIREELISLKILQTS